MTVPEFLDALYATPRTWRVEPDGSLRARPVRLCPWTVVCSGITDVSVHHKEQSVTQDIWDAADNTHGHDPKIRAALLAACGLA